MHMSVFVTVLLIVFGAWSCSSSAKPLNVPRGENATLECNILTGVHTTWYRQSKTELTLLISASKGLRKSNAIVVNYNKNPGHFLPRTENMILDIVAVGPPDIGLYYCGRQDGVARIHFGEAISLTLTDLVDDAVGESLLCWNLLIMAGSVLALILLVCLSMICYKQGFCLPVKENNTLKVMDLQYASLRHLRRTRGREPAPTPANISVVYDTVANNITSIPRG